MCLLSETSFTKQIISSKIQQNIKKLHMYSTTHCYNHIIINFYKNIFWRATNLFLPCAATFWYQLYYHKDTIKIRTSCFSCDKNVFLNTSVTVALIVFKQMLKIYKFILRNKLWNVLRSYAACLIGSNCLHY